jgi:c-di-GMP-binding flagellar brake protein YcgR
LAISAERAKQLKDHRRFYRIKTAINCRIADLTRGEAVFVYNPNLYGKIYDINIGGVFIFIETEEKYQKDDLLSFTTILNNRRLEASARVIRSQNSDHGELVGYSCSFAAITSHQEELISSYINYLQLEERRVELELEKLTKDTRT